MEASSAFEWSKPIQSLSGPFQVIGCVTGLNNERLVWYSSLDLT